MSTAGTTRACRPSRGWRRGYTAEAIRDFCERVGITKSDNLVEMALLESAIRDDLDATAPRRMAVLRPLKVVILNYSGMATESIEARNHPKDESQGTALDPVRTRDLYRSGGLRGDPAQGLQAPDSGW
jgi:glutaminyl-tRNA synthetase